MMMSSGGMPYFSVSSWYERSATASLRSRVNACACSLSSSMQPDHQRRAIALRERADALELLFAVLEVDGVDDALALAVGERQLDGLRIGGVDHHRRFDLADELFVERRDVLHLVAIGGLQADVDDVRAVADLPAGDLGRLFPLLFGDQVLEQRASR